MDAKTLFEAAAMGVALLREAPISADIYPQMEIAVRVHAPPTLHVLKYDKLLAWVNSSGPPNEQVVRAKLKKLIAADS